MLSDASDADDGSANNNDGSSDGNAQDDTSPPDDEPDTNMSPDCATDNGHSDAPRPPP